MVGMILMPPAKPQNEALMRTSYARSAPTKASRSGCSTCVCVDSRRSSKSPCPIGVWIFSGFNADDFKYYVKPIDKQAKSWDELPDDIRNTYDRLGIPEAEKNRLVSGVAAQYESEVIYNSIQEDLKKQGVIFVDTDTAVREYPELVKKYFGAVVPPEDNKFGALNTAAWSGGSFVYVPKGVHVDIPLQAYFRINTPAMGQFERTLIIADEGSYVHYVEGCTAPIWSDGLRCTPPSSRSSSKSTPVCVTPPCRTGRTTSTTSSPSVPTCARAARWNGSTATSVPRPP